MAASVEYIRGMIDEALKQIPKDIEQIKELDIRESLKNEQIAWKEGMMCAYQIIQKCL